MKRTLPGIAMPLLAAALLSSEAGAQLEFQARMGEPLRASGTALPLAFLRQDTELVRLDPTPTVAGHAERLSEWP